MLRVHTGKLEHANKQTRQALEHTTQQLQHPLLRYRYETGQYLIYELFRKQQELANNMQKLSAFLQSSANAYENAERRIKQLLSSQQTVVTKPFWNTSTSYMKFTHRFHNSISADKGVMGYINNGVCIGAYAGIHAANLQISNMMKYMQTQGNLSVGKASISVDAKAVLKQDDKWNPALILKAEASAALVTATGSIQIGNSYIHANGEVTGQVGVASAEAKAIISKDEISLKAEAGAAALQGEVKGSFTVFGATITLTGSGELGSIGGGAEFSSKKGEWELGGKLSLIAGLGFKIKVNYH